MQHVAQGLASLGRGGDTMLVHMAPDEVHGLQTLAMAAGGSLSVNPDTGLPEAFKLKSILPMIAGTIAAFIPGVNVALASVLAGAGTGALTGDKNQSLLMRAGLGALSGWGGGGIGNALMSAGKNAAGTALSSAGQAAAKEAGAGGISQVVPTAVKVGQTAAQTAQAAGVTSPAALQALKGAAGSLMQPALGTSGAQLAGMGIKNIISNPSLIGGQAIKDLGMTKAFAAASPITGAAPPVPKGSKEVLPEYQMYSYNPGKVNPKFGEPGEPYFIGQGYSTPQITNQNPYGPTYSSYDKKGKPVGPAGLSPLEQYMRNIKEQSTQQTGYASGGDVSGGIESLGRYSDGGRLLRGPGDGVSDDIPATIHRDDGTKQEARLADGEFVFPARIVSEIGNGSTEAGAQKLYAVMDKIQKDRARTINDVALDTNADRHLKALV